VLLSVIGGKVFSYDFRVPMCVVGSVRWQCVVLGVLGGTVCF